MSDDLPQNAVHPLTRAEWRAWLAANHARGQGVWLVSFKRSAGEPAVSYDEAVEEALCFGWIDSKPRALDARRTMLWFAPRKRGSGWSAINKERVERMLAAGLMAPPGLARLEEARGDGSWAALDLVDALVIPDDLAAALDALPPAREQFEAFPRSARRGILEWVSSARRPETRARRVEETARLAQQGQRANQWRPR